MSTAHRNSLAKCTAHPRAPPLQPRREMVSVRLRKNNGRQSSNFHPRGGPRKMGAGAYEKSENPSGPNCRAHPPALELSSQKLLEVMGLDYIYQCVSWLGCSHSQHHRTGCVQRPTDFSYHEKSREISRMGNFPSRRKKNSFPKSLISFANDSAFHFSIAQVHHG